MEQTSPVQVPCTIKTFLLLIISSFFQWELPCTYIVDGGQPPILKGTQCLWSPKPHCWICAVPHAPTDHRFDTDLIRVPAKILPALEARMKVERHLVVAWLQAV
jgi:hypothetical protein